MSISNEEIALLKALKENGKQVVAVIFSGGAILTEDFREYCDAIIMNFYSGMEGGNALCDIILGEVNPSGKMPITVAKSIDDYPTFKHIGDRPYEIDYDYYHGYTMFEKKGTEPRYEFGLGLSYTNFEISNLKVSVTGENAIVLVDVKNIGDRLGKEVVQIYVGSTRTDIDRPKKQLKGYKKVELKPSESKTVEISIPLNELKFYVEEKKCWEMDGEYVFYAGNSSKNANKLNQTIKIEA